MKCFCVNCKLHIAIVDVQCSEIKCPKCGGIMIKDIFSKYIYKSLKAGGDIVEGAKLKLSNSVDSDNGYMIPKGTIVEVKYIRKDPKGFTLYLEALDGETFSLAYKAKDKIPHKVVG